jgi:endonuclease/exonuclease/phosphatase family metal-dependent hydrolase
MRVLSWNVRHLRDDRAAVVRVLRAAAADVVCIQEGPRLPLHSSLSLRLLAREAGLQVAGGAWSAAGNAILHAPRMPVDACLTHRFGLNRRFGQRRGTVTATLGGVRFVSIHLGLEADERLVHVAWLLEHLDPGGPVVIAGDLNEPTGGPSWQALAALVRDPAPEAPPTFSVKNPRHRIDAILTSPGVTTLEYAAWQPDPADAARATDHFPVLSVLEVD